MRMTVETRLPDGGREPPANCASAAWLLRHWRGGLGPGDGEMRSLSSPTAWLRSGRSACDGLGLAKASSGRRRQAVALLVGSAQMMEGIPCTAPHGTAMRLVR